MSRKILAPPKEELESLYTKEGATISSLARQYSVSNPTFRKWLIDYGIERKNHTQASTEANNRHRSKSKPNSEILRKLYETSSILDLSNYYKVGLQTIYEWLDEYNIPLRTLSESCKIGKQNQFKDIQFSKEFLDQEYDRTQSIQVLAKKLNVSTSHIRSQLIKHSITIEPISPSWRSNGEIELHEFLQTTFPHFEWTNNDKKLIAPYELDIVNHEKKIAIEYCGIYWHSEGSMNRKQDYHRKKYLMCKDAGYKLITVFESDDIVKVKSLLMKLFGKTQKIGARKTTVVDLSSNIAIDFHKKHHLHSAVGAKHHYGLTYNNDLVMVASFGINRFSKKYQYECSRITSHSNITVMGGVSKLIKHFIEKEKPTSIVTFSDLRFGEGLVYLKSGFTYVEDTAPNYWYSYKYNSVLHSRVSFQKHKLKEKLETFDPLKTEYENMLDNGWDRIWDCGNAKYEWYPKSTTIILKH